jgi:hypothetical protein
MHIVKIKNKKRELPENWGELTHKQVMRIIPFLFNPLINKQDAKIYVLMRLLEIDHKLFFKMNPVQVTQLLILIEFIFDETLPDPVIKEFVHKGVKYLAPADRLSNICIIEFAMADAYFENIDYETAELNAYNKIISTLYRPEKKDMDTTHPDYNGDPREKYNTIHAEQRAEQFNDLNPYIKVSIIKFFIACKKHVADQYSILFQQPKKKEGETEAKPEKTGRKDIVPVWIGIIYDLSQSTIFGNFEQVAYTNFHTICIHLCREEIKARELENKNIFAK